MAEGELSPVLPRYRSGSDSEGELWLSLARAKTRSYGSTASVTSTLGERYIEHRVTDGDTLQGIALRYGVTMEQVKRANKLFSNDCIFLRHSLNIPVHTERPSLFNGLSLESPDGEASATQESPHVPYTSPSPPSPLPQVPPESPPRPPQPVELSAKDYLHMLDLQITRSKQAARKLKEDETREDEDKRQEASSYQEI
ncbi:lysM and putative peptidoglycan-binding domain-containing protein 2 isoform X1 [Tachysurus fulvidraco]|uniref:lysM and putative peptidoglycan-binding domain-containing protein 2 isoform X1 n=1 Tax=Tachysurus fulvidraco TaxID=1234273 RepID=UPI000F4DA97A|nr:lysM and putative peptidoglycan-binding domain-containing protein 2 isoform X1 [Tachysurus fulvidraco]